MWSILVNFQCELENNVIFPVTGYLEVSVLISWLITFLTSVSLLISYLMSMFISDQWVLTSPTVIVYSSMYLYFDQFIPPIIYLLLGAWSLRIFMSSWRTHPLSNVTLPHKIKLSQYFNQQKEKKKGLFFREILIQEIQETSSTAVAHLDSFSFREYAKYHICCWPTSHTLLSICTLPPSFLFRYLCTRW